MAPFSEVADFANIDVVVRCFVESILYSVYDYSVFHIRLFLLMVPDAGFRP